MTIARTSYLCIIDTLEFCLSLSVNLVLLLQCHFHFCFSASQINIFSYKCVTVLSATLKGGDKPVSVRGSGATVSRLNYESRSGFGPTYARYRNPLQTDNAREPQHIYTVKEDCPHEIKGWLAGIFPFLSQ